VNDSSQTGYLVELHQVLVARFSLEEIKTLCFELGVEYDDLPAVGKRNKARELVRYLDRHGRLDALRVAVMLKRPDVTWPAASPGARPATRVGRQDPNVDLSPPVETERLLRVFLCHGSEDKLAIRELYHQLSKDGLDPWLDEEDILPGQDWDHEIRKAVKDADLILVCLSSRSVRRAGYLQREIRFALDVADEQPEGAIFIIPVKLDEYQMPERLRQWHWVSLPWPWHDLAEERGYNNLIRSLRIRAEDLGALPPGQDE
jgi:hypothetical protein